MKQRTQYHYWNACLRANELDVARRGTGSTKRHMQLLALQDRLRMKAAEILKEKGRLLFNPAK